MEIKLKTALQRTLAKHKTFKEANFYVHSSYAATTTMNLYKHLFNILKDYPQVIIFTGHTHQDLHNKD